MLFLATSLAMWIKYRALKGLCKLGSPIITIMKEKCDPEAPSRFSSMITALCVAEGATPGFATNPQSVPLPSLPTPPHGLSFPHL